MLEFNNHVTGTAAALKAFDKIVMQISEFVDPNVFNDIIQKCCEGGIIESKKLSKSDQIEMKEILNTVLSEIINSISMNGIDVFDKLIMIFQSADQQFFELAEQMKSKWIHTI